MSLKKPNLVGTGVQKGFCTDKNVGYMPDPVTKPVHYNQAGIECIDALRATLGPKGFQAYCKGNVMKYLWRYEYKNGMEDLKKAEVYLGWMIQSIEENTT